MRSAVLQDRRPPLCVRWVPSAPIRRRLCRVSPLTTALLAPRRRRSARLAPSVLTRRPGLTAQSTDSASRASQRRPTAAPAPTASTWPPCARPRPTSSAPPAPTFRPSPPTRAWAPCRPTARGSATPATTSAAASALPAPRGRGAPPTCKTRVRQTPTRPPCRRRRTSACAGPASRATARSQARARAPCAGSASIVREGMLTCRSHALATFPRLWVRLLIQPASVFLVTCAWVRPASCAVLARSASVVS